MAMASAHRGDGDGDGDGESVIATTSRRRLDSGDCTSFQRYTTQF